MIVAALEAGRAANRIYLGDFEIQAKADDSPVTTADHIAYAVRIFVKVVSDYVGQAK